MRKLLFIFLIILIQNNVGFCQQTVADYSIRDNKNEFRLLMRVSDVYNILGDPINIKIYNSRNSFDIIHLEYPGIDFIYHDWLDDPYINVITFREPYKLGSENVVGQNKNEIISEYGTPKSIKTINNKTYFRYTIKISNAEHIEIQFQFNNLGICDGVVLEHSSYYI